MCTSVLKLRTSAPLFVDDPSGGSNQRENDGRRKREKNIIGKKEAIDLFLFRSHVSLEADEKWEREGRRTFSALLNVDPTQRRNEHLTMSPRFQISLGFPR